MAVELWLEVEAEPASHPDWLFEGEGASSLRGGANPLSSLPFRGHVRNDIPVGVGLGSSAAARLAASALRGVAGWGAAAREEGHSDNVVAAVFGGLRLVAGDHSEALPVPDCEVALFVSEAAQSTDLARAALPTAVPLPDAVFNAGRLAWLVHMLHSGQALEHPEAFEDRLHQPYRLPLFPWAQAALQAASASGWPAAVCGAGPSVFALTERGRGKEVAQAMAAAVPGRGRPLVTRVATSGMSVES